MRRAGEALIEAAPQGGDGSPVKRRGKRHTKSHRSQRVWRPITNPNMKSDLTTALGLGPRLPSPGALANVEINFGLAEGSGFCSGDTQEGG